MVKVAEADLLMLLGEKVVEVRTLEVRLQQAMEMIGKLTNDLQALKTGGVGQNPQPAATGPCDCNSGGERAGGNSGKVCSFRSRSHGGDVCGTPVPGEPSSDG